MKQTKRRLTLLLTVLLIMANVMSVSAEDMNTPATLRIDNENCYTGMDKTYSQGYVPRIENGSALVVIPLFAIRSCRRIRCRLR